MAVRSDAGLGYSMETVAEWMEWKVVLINCGLLWATSVWV